MVLLARDEHAGVLLTVAALESHLALFLVGTGRRAKIEERSFLKENEGSQMGQQVNSTAISLVSLFLPWFFACHGERVLMSPLQLRVACRGQVETAVDIIL